MKRDRRRWKRRQGGLDPTRLVFLDESAAKTNMTRLRGRCLRGKRLHSKAPCGRWRTTTMISTVRLDGTTACMTIKGATTGEVFYAYVSEVLLPTLKKGDILVMDNLAAHKNKETLSLLEEAGVEVLFLPPYSPDLNPIEMMWSKIKSLLRKAEARTQETLLAAIGSALSKVTPKEAANWFAHCGYAFI